MSRLTRRTSHALSSLGFNNYINVFDPSGTMFFYGYGFPTNNDYNDGALVVTGLGGGAQGNQAMQTNSQYNNANEHTNGNLLETNTYVEQFISADSLGDTWTLDFDYIKATNVASSATTFAFVKVLDAVGGSFSTIAFEQFDTTGASDTTWASGQLSLTIDPAWTGQLCQFGFTNVCTNNEDSGRIYDNIEWQGPPPPPPTMNPYAQDFDGLDIANPRRALKRGLDHLRQRLRPRRWLPLRLRHLPGAEPRDRLLRHHRHPAGRRPGLPEPRGLQRLQQR